MNNKNYFLALNRINNIGPRRIIEILKRWPDLSKIFTASLDELEKSGLTSRIAHAIKAFDLKKIEADLLWEEQNPNHTILCIEDTNYPPLLKEIYDPPQILYAKGDINSLRHECVAMVGSRNPSMAGADTAYKFAQDLVRNNICVVSGLAHGIDKNAHQGSLDAKGKTIAVMGTGIDKIYPYTNKQLMHEISVNGLILTEFPLGTPPAPGHFPRRNRIISGLSLATLVIEAATKSGSLITARFALEQNREVLAVPGSIYNPKARGCHHLLKQGAKLVSSIEDILTELPNEIKYVRKSDEAIFLAKEPENLVKCIGFEATTVDDIVKRSGLNIEKIICELTQLELNGVIKAVPGGYSRCIFYEK